MTTATSTRYTTKDGVHRHQACFEDLVVREALGQARTCIADERVPSVAAVAGRRWSPRREGSKEFVRHGGLLMPPGAVDKRIRPPAAVREGAR